MTVLTNVVRVAGKVNKRRGVTLTEKLPYDADTPIEVIIIPGVTNEEEISDSTWMQGLSSNPLFDFLKNPMEDVYTFEDGEPYHGKK